MKFDCGETWAEKQQRLDQWHRYFAWRPVMIASHDCRWLEFVERRGTFWSSWGDSGWDWQYRPLESKK